ncbi:EamA family transporter [Patescibacteria group bacterium]|nr:EamA family transporter [Patescibacteria group bacterium]MBU1472617.1 EamA family transporter [Patescibacteria group bacterium]MBU2459613.1 EamA family transporter [Patescibacteria group bacterium]MBU2544071.1 EamA family transporter [Patescibacteria group bacterium]
MPFYVYAWIAVIFYGFSGIISKLTSKHQITNPWLLTFVWSFIGTLIIIPLALSQGVGFPNSWQNMIAVAIVGALNGVLYVLAMYALDVSVLAPLYNLKTVVAIFLGIVFLGEKLNTTQWIYAFVIIVAGIFVSLDERFNWRTFFSKNIALAIISIVISAILAAAFKYVQITDGYWEVSLWSAVLSQFFLLFTVPLFWRDIKKLKPQKYSGVIVTAVFSTIAWLATIKANAVNVSITTAIISLPLPMVFAFIFSLVAPELLEKHPLKVYAVRFGVTAVMVWAAVELSR